ncbi:MAG TPA: LacI family DNA-binding transcriptional regulator [Bacteroidales bacterium]|jgi:LacI family transcriptional regulator|nr:LacI family DNA-binding transcriptional regulator [Bacteroidota bacterium]OQC02460.1 MAG: HTH-type transcriptional regulator KdgR [Bacteroidetes bacterium ADurb.Bin090]HOD27088.1 LacI family DNA-binding transcriptional regulator [Bacteroidales bacterium]HPN47674.1 LacI family DNA-binding transcriptional regulator [Bacteroidales bacterium]HQM93428.1 LacI family DNA-binding transcriptional regulator [Bacteroidales bacterium]
MAFKKKVSLKDIAQAVGVSSALVSMVLNGKAKQYGIGEEATRKVLAKAKELNYQPNIMARGLRSGRSRLLGLVVADISNPFFATLAREIERAASERGYTVIYGSSDEKPEHLSKLMNTLANQGVDGIIVVPCENSEELIADLYLQKYAMVLVDRYFPKINTLSVSLDNAEACKKVTRHLLSQGYKKIGFVSYESELLHMTERVRGYCEAMQEAGLKNSINVLKLPQDKYQETMLQVFEQHQIKNLEALIFSNNSLTIQGLYVLKQLKVRIPEDLAVFGFDGGDVFDLYCPAISYVRQPVEEMGRKAVTVLIDQLESEKPGEIKRYVLKSDLVIAESSLKKK